MRIATRISLLLLLGFVINAALVVRTVTWGSSTHREVQMEAEDATAILQRDFPGVQLEPDIGGSAQSGSIISWTVAGAEGSPDGGVWGFHVVWQSDVGWPLRSFRGVQRHWGVAMKEQASVAGMIVLPDRVLGIPMPGLTTAQGRLIPVRPLWDGLAANTLLYALAAGFFGWVATRVRRRARLDRQCCAACGYDLRAALESDTVRCPECAAIYAISAFRRPRQVLRRWMVVYCVPPLVLGAMWLLSDSLRDVPEVVRIKMTAPNHHFGWAGLASMAVLGLAAFVSVCLLASRSYADRPRSARIALAVTVSLVLTVICVPPVFVFMHGLSL